MQYNIIYRKSDGTIVRAITRGNNQKESLISLGYNPVLYDSVRVVSQVTIFPTKWRIHNGSLQPLFSREQELVKTIASEDPSDSYKLVFVGDPPSANTGFGVQYRLLQEGLQRRGYVVNSIRYVNIPQLVDMKADFVLALSDYASVKEMFPLGLDNLVYWFALESPEWPTSWNDDLKKVPNIVPITEYANKALKEKGIPSSEPIAHGVDSDVMRPIPVSQRAVLRKQNEVDGRFVISYLGTNVKRKRLDLLIKAYASFVASFDIDRKSVLLVKTKFEGNYDIAQLVREFGSQYKIANFTNMVKVIEKEMTVQEVGHFINISDLGFTATSGEGFCVPTVEYLMCGVPFLAGKHTSFPELLGSHLPLISVDDIEIDQFAHWTRYNIDTEHAAQILNQYYLNWKSQRIYDRLKLREIALNFSSDQMIQRWDRYFKNLERNKIEAQFIQKATTSLLNVETSQSEQRLYERAVQAVEGFSHSSQTAVKWIKVF